MNLNSFRQVRALKNQGYLNFMSYSKAQGPIRHLGLTILLHISFLRCVTFIPVVSSLVKSIQGLLIGYIVEGEATDFSGMSSSDLPRFASTFEPNSKLQQNEVYDYIIIGSGPGAAMAAQKFDSDQRVLVIEQGGLPKTPPSRHHTLEHVRNDFYKGGQEIAFSPWLPQFAQAAVLGGGS